jgi:predicted GTPase
MQGKTGYIRPKVVGPFPGPCASGNNGHQVALFFHFSRIRRRIVYLCIKKMKVNELLEVQTSHQVLVLQGNEKIIYLTKRTNTPFTFITGIIGPQTVHSSYKLRKKVS